MIFGSKSEQNNTISSSVTASTRQDRLDRDRIMMNWIRNYQLSVISDQFAIYNLQPCLSWNPMNQQCNAMMLNWCEPSWITTQCFDRWYQDMAVALCAHIEFDETGQKMQLRHELASTTTSMGVLESWWMVNVKKETPKIQSMPCAVCHTVCQSTFPVGSSLFAREIPLFFDRQL